MSLDVYILQSAYKSNYLSSLMIFKRADQLKVHDRFKQDLHNVIYNIIYCFIYIYIRLHYFCRTSKNMIELPLHEVFRNVH